MVEHREYRTQQSYENTERSRDAAASTQAAQVFRGMLRYWKDRRTDNSRKEALETTNELV